MASWLVVWFVVGIVSTLAVLACLIGLCVTCWSWDAP